MSLSRRQENLRGLILPVAILLAWQVLAWRASTPLFPGPWQVIGESAAGRDFAGTVAPGEAVRIFTGAAMPGGADTVLVQEEARRDGAKLPLAGEGPTRRARNVRGSCPKSHSRSLPSRPCPGSPLIRRKSGDSLSAKVAYLSQPPGKGNARPV